MATFWMRDMRCISRKTQHDNAVASYGSITVTCRWLNFTLYLVSRAVKTILDHKANIHAAKINNGQASVIKCLACSIIIILTCDRTTIKLDR